MASRVSLPTIHAKNESIITISFRHHRWESWERFRRRCIGLGRPGEGPGASSWCTQSHQESNHYLRSRWTSKPHLSFHGSGCQLESGTSQASNSANNGPIAHGDILVFHGECHFNDCSVDFRSAGVVLEDCERTPSHSVFLGRQRSLEWILFFSRYLGLVA